MTWLSDATLAHLREVADLPDMSGTKYQILEPIGRGGMGSVYLALDRELDRRIALKVLNLTHGASETAGRMLKEARILARLEHPSIVPVHDVGTLADGRVFYAMKFVEGAPLDAAIRGTSSIPDLLRIFERICDAVAFAHARGVIHRDLKPQNVMVGPYGEALVMDWGVAKLLADRLVAREAVTIERIPAGPRDGLHEGAETAHGTVIGTPGYMAPEQARGDIERVDERADVFALGAMLRFMIAAGSAPGSRPSAPKRLEAIWKKAMAEEPDARYRTAQDLSADIARFLDGLSVYAYPEGLVERTRRFARRYRTPILLVVAYLVMRMALLWLVGV